ncbi:MAG: nitrous oxide-stimulated promoter family protein [Verrucomicrobiota bacterium]
MKTTRTTGTARRIREGVMLEKMIQLYCQQKHRMHYDGLCENCGRLLASFKHHLEQCPFGVENSLCATCHVRCCRRGNWENIIRTTAPGMLWRHPKLTVRRWLDHLECASVREPGPNYSCWGQE